MIVTFNIQNKSYQVDFTKPIDISIPLKTGFETVNCFYAPPMEANPVVFGDFIGDTKQGGAVNTKNIRLNPHGNGTHTECVGHIALEDYTINQCLKQFMFEALLISTYPQKLENGDRVIDVLQLESFLPVVLPKALIIRTLPNDDLKLKTNYSGTNAPYFTPDAIQFLVNKGVEHLLIDLPSVDKEEDGGLVAAHKSFWQYPNTDISKIRKHCTITELIYVPNIIKDGTYLLNIQIASFEIDASPSKPVLYALEK